MRRWANKQTVFAEYLVVRGDSLIDCKFSAEFALKKFIGIFALGRY
jgi:hypothetical protein